MKNRKNRSVQTIRAAALVAALCGTNVSLYAGGDHVKLNQILRGRAFITQDGSITTIRVGRKTILNYDRFNIPAGTTLKFVQPGKNSRVLNRIVGGTPTSIDGTLSANGIVYIVNPSGVMFGPNSTINVGGLYAAAGRISDADFLRNHNNFTDVQGPVTNHGVIQANKFAHLIGSNVTNTGAIHAPNGLVSLSAGDEVFLAERGSKVMVRVSDQPGSSPDAGPAIENAGYIESSGSTFTVGDVYSLAMRNTGSVKADRGTIRVEGNGDVINEGTLQAHSGQVHIDAGQGSVDVSGAIDVSGRGHGEYGGSVEVTGLSVDVRGADVDASGDLGGGTILLGGGFQGQGDLAHAEFTTVDAASTIRADAITAGNGGMIVAWSDSLTSIRGDLSARGGRLVGDGGIIETSSKLMLDIVVTPDVTASSGSGGLWLIDPNDIDIVAGNGDVNVTNTDPFTSLDDSAELGIELIYGALTGGANVMVVTDTAGADTELGDITLTVPFDLSMTAGTNSLTFDAHNNINIDAPITGGVGQVLNLNLIAGETINLNEAVDLNGGNFMSTSNEFNLNDMLTANNITIAQNTPAVRGFRIANVKLATELSLTPAEIDRMTAGGVLTLGDATGIVTRVFDDLELNANTTVLQGAAVRVDGNVRGDSSLTLASGALGIILDDVGASDVDNDLDVAGVVLDGAVTLADDVDFRIDANGGDATFTDTVEGFNLGTGDESLTVTDSGVTMINGSISGSGGAVGTDALTTVSFESVGQTTLNGVVIEGDLAHTGTAGINTLGGAIEAGNVTIDVAGAAMTGAITTNTLDLTSASLTAMGRYTAADITIDSGLTLLNQGFDATGAVQVTNSGNLSLSGADSTAGSFTATSTASPTANLASGITTTGGAIRFEGQDVNVSSGILLDTTSTVAAGADIFFGQAVSLPSDLTLDAGTNGTVTFTGPVGIPAATGVLSVANAGSVNSGTINAASVDMVAQNDLDLGDITTTALAGVDLMAPTMSLDGIIATGGGGAILNNTAGPLDVDGDFLLDGALQQMGAFPVMLNGDSYQTAGAVISFEGPVTLGNNVFISSANGAANGADIDFDASIDMDGFDLRLNSGLTGDMLFAVGVDILNGGDLVIDQVNSLTLQTVTVNSFTQADGQGVTTIDGVMTTSGTNAAGNGVDITTTDLEINAAVNAPGNTVALASPDDIGIEDNGTTFNLTNADLDFIESENITVTSLAGGITIATDNMVAQDEENFAFRAADDITLNGDVSTLGSVATVDGGLDFQTNTVINAPLVTLDTTDGAISFGDGAQSAGGMTNSLTLEAGTAAISVTGTIGAGDRLDQFTATGGTIDVESVLTTGTQTYTANTLNVNGGLLDVDATGTLDGAGNAVLVDADLRVPVGPTTVNADAGDIRINGTVDGPFQLGLFASNGDVFLCETVGGVTPLASFGAFGQNVMIADVGTTTAPGVTGTLTVTAADTIFFKGDNYRANNQFWTAQMLFDQELAGGTKTFTIDSGNIFFTGAGSSILRDGLVMNVDALAGDVVFQGRIFGDTTSGAVETLNLTATDRIDLFGNVGDNVADGFVVPLAEAGRMGVLTAEAGNVARVQDVRTTGMQLYNETSGGTLLIEGSRLDASGGTITVGSSGMLAPTLLANNVTVSTGGLLGQNVNFNGTVDSDGMANHSLLVTTGAASIGFGDDIGLAGDLAASRLTSLTANGGRITFGGDVSVTSFILVNGASILDDRDDDRVIFMSNGGTVTFNGTIDAAVADGIEVVTSGGDVSFNGNVGGSSPVGFLHADVDGGQVNMGGDVTTSGVAIAGNGLHSETVLLDGATELTDTDGRVVIDGNGGDVRLAGPVDSAAGNGLEVVTDGGNIALDADLGSADALAFVNLDSNGTSTGTVSLGGNITTTGDEIGTGADGEEHTETIRVDGGATLTGNVTLTSADGDVRFADTLDGSNILTVDAGSGMTTFDGAVGGTTELTELMVSADEININGGSVSTDGEQTYDGSTILGADTVINASALDFQGSLDSDGTARDLTVNVDGLASFDEVGGNSALADLITDAPGTTSLSGDVTAGNMTFNDDVSVAVDLALNGASSVTINDALDGNGNDVTINADETFLNGEVMDVGTLMTDADGTTFIGTDSIAGEQLLFNDDVVLSDAIPGGLVEIEGGQLIRFGQTLNGSMMTDLTVTAPQTVFTGIVFGIDELLVNGAADVGADINGRRIRFLDDVQLLGDAVIGDIDSITVGLSDTESVIFDGVVTAADLGGGDRADLTVVAPAIAFNGGSVGLGALATEGVTTIRSDMETFEGATFNGEVLIADSLTIRDSGMGSIIFMDTLNSAEGAHDLTLAVNFNPGPFDAMDPREPIIGFNSDVGGASPFATLTLGASPAEIPAVATIVAGPFGPDGLIDENDVAGWGGITFNAAQIQMGMHQKMSVFGDVTLNGTSSVLLSDISALGTLSVNSPMILVRNRAGGQVAGVNGSQFQVGGDVGTDFAAERIEFSSRPLNENGIGRSNAIFAVINPRDVSSTLENATISLLSGSPEFGDLFGSAGSQSAFLDIAASGPLAGNLADVEGVAALRQQADDGEVTASATAPLTVLEQLQTFEVNVDRPSIDVLVDAKNGYATYNDDPAFLEEDDKRRGIITINRVPAEPVLAFWSEVERYVYGDGAAQDLASLQQSLIHRFDEFMFAVEGEVEDAGTEFKTYLSVVGRDPQAADGLYDQLWRLGRATDDLEKMYLSTAESEEAFNKVTNRLWVGADKYIRDEMDARPEDVMTIEQFRQVIKAFQSAPQRLVDSKQEEPEVGMEGDGAAE